MSNYFFCNFCQIQFTNETEFIQHWQQVHACEKHQSVNNQQNPVFNNAGSSIESQNIGVSMGPLALPATHTLSHVLEMKNSLLRQPKLNSARAPPELFPSFKNYFERNKQFERLGGSTEGLSKSVTLLQKLQHPTPIPPPTLPVSASGSSEKLGDDRVSLLETIAWLQIQRMKSAGPTEISPPAQPFYHCVICTMNFQDHSDFENHLIQYHWYNED